MLEQIDLTRKLKKEEFAKIFPPLELELARLQRAARGAKLPVVVVFEGWDAAGKGTCINRLMRPLDPRGYKVHPILPPTEQELYYPFLWRFWNKLPGKGQIAIFDRSWYGRVLAERVDETLPEEIWRSAYRQILDFERQLTDDGTVLVKFWLHISKKEQKQRFQEMAADPATSWKVTDEDWRQHKRYPQHLVAVEEMLEQTSTATAPWTVVEAHCARFAGAKVFETVIDALTNALALSAQEAKLPSKEPRNPKATFQPTILSRVDLSQTLLREDYEKRLGPLQQCLRMLEHEIYRKRVPVVVMFEGWDAAGKGGCIRRMTKELDPRGFEVAPIAAPNAEELAHHYLWRFWRTIPKAGHLTIFDRSWYGRVLVERVEGFAEESAWRRAYREIREFESALCQFGTVVVKFWLQIDKAEQMRRFKEREGDPNKTWKITDEDYRNRKKWDLYERAVVEMLERTSTTQAPWTIVEANCKLHARLKVLETVTTAIKSRLDPKRKHVHG